MHGEASTDFLDRQFDTIDRREREVLVDAEQEPFLEHLGQLLTACIKGLRVGVDAVTDGTRFGADPRARDASRVLRLIQTTNTKQSDPAKRTVRVLHAEESGGELLRYDFDTFADEGRMRRCAGIASGAT